MVHLRMHLANTQDGAREVTLKSALEVALELHLWLHLLKRWLTHKCVQNGSSNGGPDATVKGALDRGLNVRFEWVPQKMHNKVTKRMQLTFYLMTFALKYEYVSAVEGAPDGSFEGTPTFEVKIKLQL